MKKKKKRYGEYKEESYDNLAHVKEVLCPKRYLVINETTNLIMCIILGFWSSNNTAKTMPKRQAVILYQAP